MLTMTKAAYLSLPANTRRRRKDGSHWLKVKGQVGKWVQVTWSN